MATSGQSSDLPPAENEESRNRISAWIHRNPRQATLIGFVAALLIFAIIRGFISDNAVLSELTETAKDRWAQVQSSQESFYAANGRYAGAASDLDGAEDALSTPDETLQLNIAVNDAGDRVEMTMTGRTIRLSRTLSAGEEIATDCRILVTRGGGC